jgi:hypothetical protein
VSWVTYPIGKVGSVSGPYEMWADCIRYDRFVKDFRICARQVNYATRFDCHQLGHLTSLGETLALKVEDAQNRQAANCEGHDYYFDAFFNPLEILKYFRK